MIEAGFQASPESSADIPSCNSVLPTEVQRHTHQEFPVDSVDGVVN